MNDPSPKKVKVNKDGTGLTMSRFFQDNSEEALLMKASKMTKLQININYQHAIKHPNP